MELILFILCVFSALGGLIRADVPSKPNIIVILADDMGYGDVGCFGAKDIRTPHLDRMASEGLKLTSFYAQPICGPSRAALMTGSYPNRIGEVGNRKNGHTLPDTKEIFIAEMLRDAGYRTGIVGKWHLGMSEGCDPIAQGFQHAYFTPAFNGATRDIQPRAVVPFMRKPGEVVRTIQSQADMDTLTADCTREALEFLRGAADEEPGTKKKTPFFLYLAYHMPHVPLGVSANFRGKSARGLYGDTIEELDSAIGDIFSELKKLGIDDNTLVVFTSDNGPWTDKQIGDHGGSPKPFRGAKMTTWKGGWRVPGIVRWPGHVPAGRTSDGIAATIDLLPTFAGLSGVKLPATQLDGLDLTNFLTKSDARSPRETFLYHNGTRLTAVRHKDWKIVFARPEGGEMPYMPSFVTSHIEALSTNQLYNLRTDPGETKNLATDQPAVMQSLAKLTDESRAYLGDFTGPGTGARFFEKGPRWPSSAERKSQRPKKNKPK
ncbi:sulfatase [Prosthecobacter algae]|uniref:Sulfatase n=1 Tax=Prosthecobacter algae TaxID=1144682 RepID=A0ABP9PB79_9BACT